MVVPLLSFSCLPIRSEPLKGGQPLTSSPTGPWIPSPGLVWCSAQGGAEEHDWWTMRREEKKDHFLLVHPHPQG